MARNKHHDNNCPRHDDDVYFLIYLHDLAIRGHDNDDVIYVDDDVYDNVTTLYAIAYNDYFGDDNYCACHRLTRTTLNSGDNNMAANNGIHTPDDDAYYHCSRNDCPCNDTNTVHVDLDRILDANDSTCGHNCCDTGTCDCAYCDRTCGICPN